MNDREQSILEVVRLAAEEMEKRRVPVNRLAMIGLTITLALNMVALVWGAATLSATVSFQGQQTAVIAQQLARATEELNDLEGRVRVIEATNERQ